MGKQDSIIHDHSILLGRNKRALGKERVGYKCIMSIVEKQKTKIRGNYKFTCVKYTCCLVIALCLCECVCAEEGSEEKINEEGTSTSNSLLGSYHVPSFGTSYLIDSSLHNSNN